MEQRIKNYLISQLDKTTAWIGFIGLILMALHLYSFMFILFVAMIFLPETSFSSTFKKWAGEVRNAAK